MLAGHVLGQIPLAGIPGSAKKIFSPFHVRDKRSASRPGADSNSASIMRSQTESITLSRSDTQSVDLNNWLPED